MKTVKSIAIMVLAAVMVAAIGGCKSKSSSAQANATAKQDNAAKSLGISKELTLDLGNKVTMKLVLIPSGKFMMGSPKTEEYCFEQEGPQHEVTISKTFYMGACTVTQEQYEQIMGKNPSGFKGAQNPVERVSWNDAVDFCKAISEKTGEAVRLPTEAQWEYACRAGSTTRFNYGDADNELGDYAWYAENDDNKTHAVGQKKPNSWGLYDMHGNVWEWCSDWYVKDYYANSPQADPQGPESGEGRVIRGSPYGVYPNQCRSAYRDWNEPSSQSDSVGFRVVVECHEKEKCPSEK